MININRVNICGFIDGNTPKCVLEEICMASSIKFNTGDESPKYINKIIQKIYSYRGENINEKYEENKLALRIIARFVNADHKEWRREVLLKAYKFLISFSTQNSEQRCREFCLEKRTKRTSFDYGKQTSSLPFALNACVLYKICRFNHLNVNFLTSIDEMAAKIKLSFSLDTDYLNNTAIKNTICDIIRFNAKSSELINILSVIDPTLTPDILSIQETQHIENDGFDELFLGASYEKYSTVADEILSNENSERNERKEPKDNIEAVVMGAIYHKIDLSKCDNPKIEYELLEKSFDSDRIYFPFDENLKKRLHETYLYPESFLNPHLNVNFNPNFPVNMYSQSDLINMCNLQEIECEDNPYTCLQMAYLTESFFHGKQGNITNKSNTSGDLIEDLTYDDVVVYGVRENRSVMRAFTYYELYDIFSTYKKFSNPATREIFNPTAMKKLHVLTQKDKRSTETEENYHNRLELKDEIERIQIYQSTTNKCLEEFLRRYEKATDEDKNKVEDILTNLLHCGMYMRNWDGKGDFPLKSEQTNYDVKIQQIVIDDNVTQSLIKLENSAKLLNGFGNFIMNMPLMEYNFESKIFVTVSDHSEGLTIKDRIGIVRTGENSFKMSSCIRLTSNKFCASAFYYMILIGFKLPFSISEVSHIF